MSKVSLGALVAVLCFAATTWAAPIINVGTHNLAPNEANQVILINVTGTDLVAGFCLKAQIGSGFEPSLEPVFQSISFSGGMWDANRTFTSGGPIEFAENLADASVVFQDVSSMVAANGLVVKMLVNTTGFNSGDFTLKLSNTDHEVDSYFLAPDASPIAAEITNGSIHITPEPATLALLGLGGLALLRRRNVA